MLEAEAKLRKIIATTIKIPESNFSSDDDLIAKYGMDSMQRIEIVIATEKDFGIEISDDEAAIVRTLSDFLNLIKRSKTTSQ